MRVPLGVLLFATTLVAEGPGDEKLSLDLRTEFGVDPAAQIRLVPPGCWDGLILSVGAPQSRPRPSRRPLAEATVEVWDLALRESPRRETFGLYLRTLRQRLSRALEQPPPSHQSIELSEYMLSDPGNPQLLDLTRVQALQERFNRLPPNESPVK